MPENTHCKAGLGTQLRKVGAPCAEILHWQKMMDAAGWDWRGEENRDKIEQRGGNGEPLSAQQSASQPHRSAVFFSSFLVVLSWKRIREIYQPISCIIMKSSSTLNCLHVDARGTAKRLSTMAGNGKTAYKNCTSLQRVLAHYAG